MADTWDFKYLKNLVKRRINHEGIDHIVEDAINETIQDIASRSSFSFLYAIRSFATVASTETLAAPTDINGIIKLWDTSNDRYYEPLAPRHFFEQFAPLSTPANGVPNWYTYVETSNLLYFYPVPDAIYNLEMLATITPTLLEKPGDIPAIPQRDMSKIVYGSIARIKDYQDRPSSKEWAQYEAGIRDMIARDFKVKDMNRSMFDKFRQRRVKTIRFISGGYEYD